MSGDIMGANGRPIPTTFSAEQLENAPDQQTQWAAYVEGAKAAIHNHSRHDIPSYGKRADGSAFALRGHPILMHQFRTGFDEVAPQMLAKDQARYREIKRLVDGFGLKGIE